MTGRQPHNPCASKIKFNSPMKTIKVITAVVLLTGLTSLSFAGAGPDYWIRMNQAAKDKTAIEAKAKADSPTKVQAATQVASCATCGCAGMKKS